MNEAMNINLSAVSRRGRMSKVIYASHVTKYRTTSSMKKNVICAEKVIYCAVMYGGPPSASVPRPRSNAASDVTYAERHLWGATSPMQNNVMYEGKCHL